METSDVRRRIKDALDRARKLAAERRALNSEAAAAYETFLQHTAIPVFQQVASALKAEGYLFVVHTPAGSVRLVSEKSGSDFVDLRLDTTGARPQVMIRTERRKGREMTSEEHPLEPGVAIGNLSDENVLDAVAASVTILA